MDTLALFIAISVVLICAVAVGTALGLLASSYYFRPDPTVHPKEENFCEK